MRRYLLLGFALFSSPALSSPHCTSEPQAGWMPAAMVKAKAEAVGHVIDVFKATKGNCYEIYGHNAKGQRIEIYYNPVTGDPVQSNLED
jgi:hypothetical protein